MVIVHGPAGFGKTTLLAQAAKKLRDAGETVVWLTADSQDKSPQIFLDNLTNSCRLAGLEIPDRSMSVTDLCACLPADSAVTFILDELEHLVDSDSILVLREVCLESPDSIRLIVGTREVPLAHMTQLYINGVVDLIESTEIQFQDNEAQALLGASLNAEEIPEVIELAEGWAIILQLAKIHASNIGSPRGIVSELRGTKTQTFHYLLEQIFSQLEDEQAELLKECSILSYVDADAANAIGQRDDAHALLRTLTDLQPIITITSEEPVAFRFHPLFREFLLEIQKRQGVEYVAMLHRRAAGYYYNQHMLVDAVRHAISADDMSLAAEFLEKAGGMACVFDVGPAVLDNLLDQFSDEWLESRPILGAARVILRAVQGDSAYANYLFSQLFGESQDYFDLNGDERDDFAIVRNLAQVFVLMSTDIQVPLTSAYFNALDTLGVVFQRHFPGDARYRALLLALRVIVDQRYESVAVTARRLEQYKDVCEGEGFAPKLPSIAPQMGLVAYGAGDFEPALAYLVGDRSDVARQFGKREEVLQRVSAGTLARIYYERDELESAREHLLPIGDSVPLTFAEIAMSMYATRALCWFGLGQGNRAIRFLDEWIRQAKIAGVRQLESSLLAIKIECLFRLGRNADAVSANLEHSFDSCWEQNFARAPWAWVLAEPVARATVLLLVASQQTDKAEAIAYKFAGVAAEQGRRHMEVIGLILGAIVQDSAGNEMEARNRLGRALEMGADMRLIRPFLDLDAILLPSFRHYATESSSSATGRYVAAILSATARSLRLADSIADLTSREMDILCELAHGDGRKVIAKRLGVSPETVKHHTKGLYTKLNASSAHEALINAWHSAHSGAD